MADNLPSKPVFLSCRMGRSLTGGTALLFASLATNVLDQYGLSGCGLHLTSVMSLQVLLSATNIRFASRAALRRERAFLMCWPSFVTRSRAKS